MNAHTRRPLALLTATLLALPLAACSSTEDTGTDLLEEISAVVPSLAEDPDETTAALDEICDTWQEYRDLSGEAPSADFARGSVQEILLGVTPPATQDDEHAAEAEQIALIIGELRPECLN